MQRRKAQRIKTMIADSLLCLSGFATCSFMSPCANCRCRCGVFVPGVGGPRAFGIGLRTLGMARAARPAGSGPHLRRRPQREHAGDPRILAEHNVPATFFQCGANVDRLPGIAREVAARGHEIGNHSYSHPYLFLRSPGAIEDELRRAQEAIAAAHRSAARLVPRALRRALVRTRAGAAENATDRRDVDRNRL